MSCPAKKGGLESIVTVGGQMVLSAINIVALSPPNVNTRPSAPRQAVIQQFPPMNAQPVWPPMLAAWQRLWAIPLHVALAVFVLQVFRRQRLSWLFLALLLHALVDFVAGALPQAFVHAPIR